MTKQNRPMPFKCTLLGMALAGMVLPQAVAQGAAVAGSAPELREVTVRAAGSGESALSPSVPAERRRLTRIPGGTALALPQQEARLTTLGDALAYQPGVVVQEMFGGIDAPRLGVRGSGIQSHPVKRGLTLLQDGLPINEADGSYISGLLDVRHAAQISIRRGANARSLASESLGGEMDFQSFTGLDGRGRARLEAASFARRAALAAFGGKGNNIDAHVSLGAERHHGFRHHSDGQRKSMQANVGYRGAGGLENRTWLAWTDFDYRIPGPLPPGRVYGDPSQVLGDADTPRDRLLSVYQRNPHRNASQWRIANRLAWGSERLRHELGVWWQRTEAEEQNLTTATRWHGRTAGLQWQTSGQAGKALRWRLAAAWTGGSTERDFHAISPRTGAALQRFGSFDLDAQTAHVSAGADAELAPGWTLTGDLRFSRTRRSVKNRTGPSGMERSWRYATPKIGVIWQATPRLRAFASVSRSHEAPTFYDLVTTSVAASNPARAATALVPLDMQRATTLEAGAQGSFGAEGAGADAMASGAHWQLTLYRSAIRGELIRTVDAAGLQTGTYNYAGGTRHQGLEAGINGRLRLAASAFDWRAAWTWSDFRFRGGPYAGKRIAGVPRHFVQAELLYRAGGWRAGPTLRWQPLDEYVDHANTPGYVQRRYALLGLRGEYRRGPWSIQLQADNLTNRRYASAMVVTDRANPNINLFPGSGRSFSISASYNF